MTSRHACVILLLVLVLVGIGGCNFPGQRPGANRQAVETNIPTISFQAPSSQLEDQGQPMPHTDIAPTESPVVQSLDEAVVNMIPISGPGSLENAEISGMTWFGDTLLILPQYPNEHPSARGPDSIFSLQRAEILAYLEGSTQGPLEIGLVPIVNADIAGLVPGYEGYEAIAVHQNLVYLAVEANYRGMMQGYMIEGRFSPDESAIVMDPDTLTEIPTPVQIFNAAYESLLIANGKVMAIYEAYGRELNPDPLVFSKEDSSPGFSPVPFEAVEYRLTDATDIDSEGRFWVMNVFIPIEFWYYTAYDPLTEQYGQGLTHAANMHIERLLELKYNEGQISLSGRPPIQLELNDDAHPRNWEALVRLNELGFLAMTDTYPGTILAYISNPGSSMDTNQGEQ